MLVNQYLFDLADICGLSARDVDALSVDEFLIYLQGVDQRREQRKAIAPEGIEKGTWIP